MDSPAGAQTRRFQQGVGRSDARLQDFGEVRAQDLREARTQGSSPSSDPWSHGPRLCQEVWQELEQVKESTSINSLTTGRPPMEQTGPLERASQPALPSPPEPTLRVQEEELHRNFINWLQEELS